MRLPETSSAANLFLGTQLFPVERSEVSLHQKDVSGTKKSREERQEKMMINLFVERDVSQINSEKENQLVIGS
jgi:hypothetical protein